MHSRYNMDAIVQQIHMLSPSEKRLDAGETAMLEQQLEFMRAAVMEVRYEDLYARRFLPVATDVDTGAEFFTYTQTDEVGEAKIIRNFADDAPTVEVNAEKIRHDIVSLGDSYNYSIQDMRRAAFSGVPLDARKAMAARKAFERGIDTLAAEGSAQDNIVGFLKSSVVGITTPVGAVWAGLTADEILTDLNKLVSEMIIASKETYLPDTVLLPTAQHILVSQRRMSTSNGNDDTVLTAFRKANPSVARVESWNKLATAAVGGGARGVAFRADREVCEVVIPQEFEVLPPQPKNYAFNVLAHGRTAGCAIYRPLGMRYIDTI